jgi:NitT/TauT family transport system substrate-binding protein
MATIKLKTSGKIAIGLLVIGAIFGLKVLFGDKIFPSKSISGSELTSEEQEQVIKIGVVTWGGYAGGQYFNGGFKASKESRFYKEYGILVEFKLLDDFNASREAFKNGEVDLLWQTADAFPTEVNGLKEFSPKIVFQSDWSRGGDAIVVRKGITSVNELKGKKIAVAPMTPSHTFLLNILASGGISTSSVDIVQVANAMDAADLFKKQQVDAAVVWSPDDQACIEAIEGSKILVNTKTARNIIADIFFAKSEYIDSHQKELKGLVEGWLKGAAELNASDDAKHKAAKILAEGLNQPEDFCYGAINNARLCTYGDNANFFNISGKYDGVTGEDLYSNMTVAYTNAGFVTGSVPAWRAIAYPGIIKEITALNGPTDGPEMGTDFQKNESDKSAAAISTKKVTISFAFGSYTLDENSQYTIDKEFVSLAKGFSGAKIRIEGNTDNVGSPASNRFISEKRAQAVADYLIKTHGFNPNRIIVVGNGPDKPVAENTTEDGRSKNRRTDFELIAQ